MTAASNDEIKFTVDKFIFRFPQNLLYSQDGLWIRQEEDMLRIGVGDYAQQRNGDIAFATLPPIASVLNEGDEIASIETVKINFSLPSPMPGKIVDINASLQDSPELINLDPYGKGWLVLFRPENLGRDYAGLMTAETYSKLARQQAESELNS
jgi:glycine cleavage system H protein